MDNIKIEILLDEKRNLRNEILLINKITYGSLFTSITIIGALCGYLIGNNGLKEFLINRDYLLYGLIVSQIEFIIGIFIFSLNSSIVTISAYISSIDERINQLKNERLLLWESEGRHFQNSPKGVQFFCLIIICTFFYFIFIISMFLNLVEFITTCNYFYFIFILLQSIELLVSLILIRKKYQEFEKVQDFFNNLIPSNSTPNEPSTEMLVKRSVKRKPAN